jgi:Zn-dependent protease
VTRPARPGRTAQAEDRAGPSGTIATMSRILLLLFAALKFGKLFGTIATMLLSIGVYALIFGWRYAVGFVALLFVHEMGHFIAARQRGLPVGLPTFIPFMGAWIEMKQMPHDAETEAFVGLGGPLLGTVGALACYFLARNYDIDWLLAVSYGGFFLNLFNMIPLSPFDGGRITAVLSPRIWLLGVPILGLMLWYRFSPILLLVAILAAPHVMTALRYRKDSPEAQTYYAVSPRVRWEYGFYYVVLITFLAMMTYDVSQQLRHVERGGEQQAEPVESGNV